MPATTAESRARNARRYAARPRTPIPASACALRALTVSCHNGLAPAVGETTAVPGVLLTPLAHGEPLRFTGEWCLTHAATGLRVSPPASYLHTVEAVEWLRRTGLDWDRPVEALHADAELEAAYAALNYAVWDACREHRPLLPARTSWVDWPPLWRIRHHSRVAVARYLTWDDAADYAETACTAPGGALQPDAVIYRDTVSPGWALRCASIACTDTSWLIDWCDEGEGPALGTRAELAVLAVEDGWHAHPGGHWTCPECTRRYH
ncbi:hypothetical protein [Amycolatopsis rifamycinica]|uniref:Uncharacterized protein n=1 Tax=Amycolatopsis rifamycinica TaxID=287986 RepID=A0A066U6Z7_9PSEU|nr:hypothetical protein [Amycolatopsis rifamycinica]KDN23206.1 hypothetical protein DV20_05675 [Amycolatopsis rifamycinica]